MVENLSYTGLQKQWINEEDIEHVVKDLNDNINSVITLQLSGNTLGVNAAEKLIEPLSNQSKIKKLIWNDLFTGRLKTEISVALSSLSTGLMRAQVNLVEIDLSDNAFGPNGVVGVTELLASSCCYTLKTLNMNNQGLGHQGCRQLVDALKKARINSNYKGMNLEVFIAGRNRLENAGMKMLTEFFSDGMTSLKKIVLLQNGIGIHGIDGVENLISSLKNHINLKVLDISDNTIKPEGVKRLSKVLPYFEDLEELHLGDCLIGNSGLGYLTKNLDSMSLNLKIISVSGNEITGNSARKFVSTILQTKHSIEKIDLTENEIKKTDYSEIKDIVTEFDKSDVLVEDVESSDGELSEEESDDYEGSDKSNNEGDSSTDEEEEEYSDEYNESDSYKDDEKEETKELFTSTNTQSSLFGNNIDPSKPSLFNGTAQSNLFARTNEKNIFKTSDNSAANNIFGTPQTKPFSFLNAANNSLKPDGKEVTGELFSSKNAQPSLFDSSKPANLFDQSNQKNIFNSAAKSIFGTPATKPFLNSANNLESSNVESIKNVPGGLFAQSQNKPFVFTRNIDSNQPSLFNGTAQSNLFGMSNKTNIFKPADIFGTPSIKPFSFLEASVNPNTLEKEVIDYVSANLQSISLMSIKHSNFINNNKTLGNFSFDASIYKSAERFPENAVRVGLMLCKNSSTFDAAVELISFVLLSKTVWNRATNAILVEMDCIKCEEKKFVPFSVENPNLPIKVLNSVLERNSGLPNEVKSNLTVVMKNLSKKSSDDTDELLKKLECCVNNLRI